MSDNIYVQIFNNNDEAVSVLRTDSVRAYAMRGLTNTSFNAVQKTMMVDMLNYGAEAQAFFKNYHIDDLANALMSEEQKSLATATVEYSNKRDTTDANGYYVGSTLTLENSILMTLYFKNISRDMRAVVTFTNHSGSAQEIEVSGSEFKANGSYLGVEVDEIVVADARQLVTVKIYDGDTLLSTVSDSIESNAARSTGELFDAIMRFADSAYKMFREQEKGGKK